MAWFYEHSGPGVRAEPVMPRPSMQGGRASGRTIPFHVANNPVVKGAT